MRKLSIIILAVALLTSCSYNKDNLALKGDIQNNIISQSSTVAGKIIEMNKGQGESVKKGDIIAVIDNANQKYSADQLQAVVNMKKAKLDELQAGTRHEQIEQAQAQVDVAKAQLDLLESGNRSEQIEQAKNAVLASETNLQNAKITYDRIKTDYNNYVQLSKTGAISQNDLDTQKTKMDTASNQLDIAKTQLESSKQQLTLMQNGSTVQAIEGAKANYKAVKAQLNLLKSGATSQAIAFAKADLQQSTVQLQQAIYNLSNYNIVALADGIISSRNFQLGDVVNVGSNIVDIAVDNDIYVLCYIPDKYLDKIKYNQTLTVNTSLGPQDGKVSYIALNTEYKPKDEQTTSDTQHVVTKIKVNIDSLDGKLKSGMEATVDIPLK